MHDRGASAGQGHPVALPPDSLRPRRIRRLEVGALVARAVLVAPDPKRHRRHRGEHDEFPNFVAQRPALLIPRFCVDTQAATGHFSLGDRQPGCVTYQRSREVGSPADNVQREVRADFLIEPAKRARRRRRAGHAHRLQRGQIVIAPGVQAGLLASQQIAGAGAEAGQPVLTSQLPQPVGRRPQRAAVVQDCGGAGRQRRDLTVPHDPAG